MLELLVPGRELFNEETSEFSYTKEATLQLEHSLLSISAWESKWHKPFLGKDDNRKLEETIDYIRCMTLNKHVDPSVYNNLTDTEISKVIDYIENPMTATTFRENKRPPSREIITSELIYYWMVSLNIPFECQKWHLNRLLTLIQVCNIKNTPPKKMGRKNTINQNHALNQARRASLGTSG